MMLRRLLDFNNLLLFLVPGGSSREVLLAAVSTLLQNIISLKISIKIMIRFAWCVYLLKVLVFVYLKVPVYLCFSKDAYVFVRFLCITSMRTSTTGTCSTGTGRTSTVYTRLVRNLKWLKLEMRKSFKVGPPMPMPQQMTICLRTLHYTFMFPKSSYAFAFFFGSLLPVNFFSYLIFLNSSGRIGSLLNILHKYIPDKQITTNTNHITLLTL